MVGGLAGALAGAGGGEVFEDESVGHFAEDGGAWKVDGLVGV